MHSVSELCPLLGLRISAGPLELRGVTDTDVPALCDVAAAGIHPEDQMPFSIPWSIGPPDEVAARVAAYHWRCRGEWSAERWSLQLGVWYDGVLVGCQGMQAIDYLITRTPATGSWLGRDSQGRGIGTAMRQVICAFAFDCLDAEEVRSSAFLDNKASIAVSRKVGYTGDGTERERLNQRLAVLQRFRLTPSDLVRYQHPLSVEGLQPLRRSIGLSSTDEVRRAPVSAPLGTDA